MNALLGFQAAALLVAQVAHMFKNHGLTAFGMMVASVLGAVMAFSL